MRAPSSSRANWLGFPAATLLVPLILAAGCGDGDDSSGVPSGSGAEGGRGDEGTGGTKATGGTGQDAPGAAGGDTDDPGSLDLGPATQLAAGSASLVGVTGDGWVLYRDTDSLRGAKADGRGDAEVVSDAPGNVIVKGRVVFNWADVDWTKNVGDLSVWTPSGGQHEIGKTLFSETLVAASEQGQWLVYTANSSKSKTDLMLASADFSTNEVLIEDVGLGSDDTCSPSLGFVGERLIVGYCAPGTRDARIVRFAENDGSFEDTLIAKNALSAWSADASGDRIFYQNNAYEGFYYAEDGESYRIDASVSRGFLLPDGSAVLYTVGDQLRRSTLPEANPIPVVTTGFSEPVAFTEGYGSALYSSKVSYVNGTQRDLRLVPTDSFEPEPVEIVAEPVATLGRSNMTEDGSFVLFLTDVGPRGGTLHAVGLDGEEVWALDGVLDVVKARGSAIVYTDNASDPEIYPNVADLKYVDVASGAEPLLIEAQVLDPKNFQLEAGGTRVVYARSGLERDVEDPEHDGLFSRELR